MKNERYKHFDYWLSTVLVWGCVYGFTFAAMKYVTQTGDCFTGQQIVTGLAVFVGWLILMLPLVGWNIYTVEKYEPYLKSKLNRSADITRSK